MFINTYYIYSIVLAALYDKDEMTGGTVQSCFEVVGWLLLGYNIQKKNIREVQEMSLSRIVTFILGILMIMTGMFCLMNPAITYMTLGYIIGINMIVDAIGCIVIWNERKNQGESDGWMLAGAILSLLFGIALIGSNAMQIAVDMIIVYIAAIWLILIGIISVVLSNRLRTFQNAPGSEDIGKRWWLPLITGVLLIICGVLGFVNPAGLIVAIGIQMGLTIIILGVNLIAVSA